MNRVYVLQVILGLFFFAHNLEAMELRGTILEKTQGHPIPYAYAELMGKGIGTVSNEKGEFVLSVPDSLIDCELTFSAIGYKKTKVALSILASEAKVYLDMDPIALKEVVVKPGKKKKTKLVTWGFKPRYYGGSFGINPNTLTFAIGVVMNNENHKAGYIKNVKFCISNMILYELPFRIRLYEIKNKKPGNEIFGGDSIYRAKKPGWFVADLSKYEISVPIEGYLAVMEVLPFNQRDYLKVMSKRKCCPSMGFAGTIEKGECVTYVRKFGLDWIDANIYWTAASKFVKKGMSVNAVMTSDVYLYE